MGKMSTSATEVGLSIEESLEMAGTPEGRCMSYVVV